jgi:hypothetical protein
MDGQPDHSTPYSQGGTPSPYTPGEPTYNPPMAQPYMSQDPGWQTLPSGYAPQVPPSHTLPGYDPASQPVYPPPHHTPPGYQTFPSGAYAPPPPGYAPPPPGYGLPYAIPQPSWPVQQRPSGTPVAVEAILALFGFYGIGWLMAGNTTTGVLLLIGGLVWDIIAVLGTVFTLGVGACIFGPIHIGLVVLSSVLLSDYLKSGRATLS